MPILSFALKKKEFRAKTAVSDQPTPGNGYLFFEIDLGVINKMKKVIVLSTVLGISALGMACGEAANTNTSANKPANVTVNANVATPAPAATVAANTNANAAASTSDKAPVANATNTAKSANMTVAPANANHSAGNANTTKPTK
jgi:hypothetical protein